MTSSDRIWSHSTDAQRTALTARLSLNFPADIFNWEKFTGTRSGTWAFHISSENVNYQENNTLVGCIINLSILVSRQRFGSTHSFSLTSLTHGSDKVSKELSKELSIGIGKTKNNFSLKSAKNVNFWKESKCFIYFHIFKEKQVWVFEKTMFGLFKIPFLKLII